MYSRAQLCYRVIVNWVMIRSRCWLTQTRRSTDADTRHGERCRWRKSHVETDRQTRRGRRDGVTETGWRDKRRWLLRWTWREKTWRRREMKVEIYGEDHWHTHILWRLVYVANNAEYAVWIFVDIWVLKLYIAVMYYTKRDFVCHWHMMFSLITSS